MFCPKNLHKPLLTQDSYNHGVLVPLSQITLSINFLCEYGHNYIFRCLHIVLYLYTPMCTSVYVNVYRRTTDTNTLPHFVPMDTHTHLRYMGSSHFKFNVFILSQILTIELKCSSWQCSIFPVASEWEGGCLSLCLKIPSGTRPERPVLVAVSCWGRRAWHGAAECSK